MFRNNNKLYSAFIIQLFIYTFSIMALCTTNMTNIKHNLNEDNIIDHDSVCENSNHFDQSTMGTEFCVFASNCFQFKTFLKNFYPANMKIIMLPVKP